VFVVAAWASEPADRFLSWTELKQLAGAGASVGSHSVSHANFRGLETSVRRTELRDSRTAIAHNLGLVPELFAIPFGRAHDWDAECTALAHEAGYTRIFAQSELRRPRGTIGRSFVAKYDGPRQFRSILEGRLDRWVEWF
ncbi:MAG: polysaccharide deacetylase family protein, partial [Tepidiformaceae bacterium]